MIGTINHKMVSPNHPPPHTPKPNHQSQGTGLGDLLIRRNMLPKRHSLWQFTVPSSWSQQGNHRHRALSNPPPWSLIIAPPVSSGWSPAPTPSPPLECFQRAHPSARNGPLSPLGSPETSRSSTWGFSARNLKEAPHKKDIGEGRNTDNIIQRTAAVVVTGKNKDSSQGTYLLLIFARILTAEISGIALLTTQFFNAWMYSQLYTHAFE